MPCRLFLALALAVLVAACGRDVDPPRPAGRAIPPATFAAVLTELAVARAELLPDSAAYRARMAQILARYRVTPAELHAFVDGYSGNEDVLQPIYRTERARIDSFFGAGGLATPVGVDNFQPAEPATAPAAADTTAPDTTAGG